MNLGKVDLINGNITSSMLRFALPLMLGNLLQQCYNIADTLIVGRVLGAEALAAVGSSYALIVFVTSIFIGLSMGCSAVFSMQYGVGDVEGLRQSIFSSVLLVGCRKRSIPTHSERLNPSSFTAKLALKSA